MSKDDAAMIKVLADLGLRREEPLTPEQERLMQLALDPEEQFYQNVVDLMSPK